MRKFNTIVKEKQDIANTLHEQKVLQDYSMIYSALLNKWNTNSVSSLSLDEQESFDAELNALWESDKGITKKGSNFLIDRSMFLTESSTDKQKKHYLNEKLQTALSKIINESSIKKEFYDILDEMYKQTNSKLLDDVLKTEDILKLFNTQLSESIKNVYTSIKNDLSENVKSKSKYYIIKKLDESAKLNTFLSQDEINNKKTNFENVIISSTDNDKIFETLQNKFFLRDRDDELMMYTYEKILRKHNLYESFEEFIQKQL